MDCRAALERSSFAEPRLREATVRMRMHECTRIGTRGRGHSSAKVTQVKISNLLMATSAEPARKVGYSPDMGWRVVWQRVGMGLSFRSIALRLQICLGTAHKIYTSFVEIGEVAFMAKVLRHTC